MRGMWRKTGLEESSELRTMTTEWITMQNSSCHFPYTSLETVQGHMGRVSGQHVVYQQNPLERGWERRDRHRRLILVTLETRKTEQKRQLLYCFYLKWHLNLFFTEEMDKEKNEHIHFLYLWRPTEVESALQGKRGKVTAFTQLHPLSLKGRLACEELLCLPLMLIECADRGTKVTTTLKWNMAPESLSHPFARPLSSTLAEW